MNTTTTLKMTACVLCASSVLSMTPIETGARYDYNSNTSGGLKGSIKILTTTGSDTQMSDTQIYERVATLEANRKHLDEKMDTLITICTDMNKEIATMGKDIASLKEGMTWTKRGVLTIAGVGVIAVLKYLFI